LERYIKTQAPIYWNNHLGRELTYLARLFSHPFGGAGGLGLGAWLF